MILDQLIGEFDHALRTVFVGARTRRPFPGQDIAETPLSDNERRHAAGLMRVNHSGEVCAQALYRGQALTCGNETIRSALADAAFEETEHLAWTEQRLAELGDRKSFLNPLWYVGAFTLGVVAGKVGDKWNLGFLAETERQVESHLDGHLQKLPAGDGRSMAMVEQMRDDEARHANMAISLGGAELPPPIRMTMKLAAKVMTVTAYRL